MLKLNRPRTLTLLLLAGAAGLLSGCGGSFAPGSVTPEQVPVGNIQGRVHGGNLPISGSAIYLYQASTSGYGTAATSLICNSGVDKNPCPTAGTYGPFKDGNGNYYVLTDSNGDFALGGAYACTQNAQVYMVALGGNPGLGSINTTATFSSGSYTITLANASNVNVGAFISGSGVSGTVTGVSGTTVTLSQQTTASGSGASVAFSVYNPAIVQMTGLGTCPAAGNLAAQVPWLVINEVTTVGFAYAMGGFATTPYNVSADASGATGLKNAMNNFLNIVNVGSGLAYPSTVLGNTNSVSPAQRINTLANILATCVNQTNSNASSCTNLFRYATTLTGTAATDEGSAIFNIVHNQAVEMVSGTTVTQNATNLYNLMNGNEPFSSPLSKAPSDWTMPVIYNSAVSALGTGTSGYNSGAFGMAFDAEGNAWMGDRAQGVVEIGPQGAITLYGNKANGFSMVKGVAISPQDGSIWVTDYGSNAIYVTTPSSTPNTLTKVTTITTDVAGHGPDATAFALNPLPSAGCGTRSYLAYEGEESATGIVAYDGCTYAVDDYETGYTNLTSPGWIAVDANGAAWIPSLGSTDIGGLTTIEKVTNAKPNGVLTYAASTQTDFAQSYVGVADGLGNLWVPSQTTTYTLYQAKAGAYQGGYKGGGMDVAWRAAVDGNNVVWLANLNANTISAFSVPLAGESDQWMSSTGFSSSAPTDAYTGVAAVGVDLSGDVWTANADGTVTQLLGLGSPTAAPLYGGQTVTVTTTTPHTTTYTNGNLGTKP